MESEMKPKNVFEQILFGQLAINGNIVAVSKSIEVLSEQIKEFMSVFTASSAVVDRKTENCLTD